jgi:hypothetical protein
MLPLFSQVILAHQLMMLGSIFRLVNIRYEGQLCIIQLTLCSENGHDVKLIFDKMKIDYLGEGNTHAGVFGTVLANMGKFDQAEKYMQHELNESSSGDDKDAGFFLKAHPVQYQLLDS